MSLDRYLNMHLVVCFYLLEYLLVADFVGVIDEIIKPEATGSVTTGKLPDHHGIQNGDAGKSFLNLYIFLHDFFYKNCLCLDNNKYKVFLVLALI